MTSLASVTGVGAGRAFACGLAGGGVYCWGNNTYGQAAQSIVRQVSDSTQTVVDLAVGAEHACLLHSNGTVVCWGRNQASQLGTAVSGLTNAVEIQAGDHTSRSPTKRALWTRPV